ncbi:MAG: beta-ketoacyl synthase N-terminal-like domain-containing protein [Desulfobacteraceae bacterium]
MYVHDTAVLLNAPDEAQTALVEKVRQQTGLYFRRVNRFILLSLAGAHQCVAGRTPDPGTMVCLTTENGSVQDTETTLAQLFHEQSYPKPYNFINTMSNTATFYIAQSMKLRSPNMTLAAMQFAFERGLELARTDLFRGAAEYALVGGVDQAVLSKLNQRRFGDRLVDGSAWMYLSRHKTGASGEIAQIRSFYGTRSALDGYAQMDLPADPVLALGIGVPGAEYGQWQAVRPGARAREDRDRYGYSGSAAACGICGFFQGHEDQTLVHVNKDHLGHYTLLTATAY